MSNSPENNSVIDSHNESDSGESEEAKIKTQQEIMKSQEEQLKSKYAGVKGPGPSNFLLRQLTKGTKYFDSGDYYTNKDGQKSQQQGSIFQKHAPTGDTIPTLESVIHKKNPNISSLATS